MAALYTVAGFFVAPLVVKGQLEDKLSQALQRKVSVEAVRVNPFAPSLTIRNLAIQNREDDGVLAGFEELYVNAAWTSVLRLAPVVDEVKLAKPVLNVRRGADRRYNFQDLLERRPSSGGGEGEGRIPRFAVFNIRVADGRLVFDDRAEGARHEVTEIRLGIPHLSSLPAHAAEKVRPELAMKVNGAPLSLGGDSLPFDPARPTHLAVNVEGFDLTRLAAYLPSRVRAKLASALADARLTLGFEQADGKARLVLGGEAVVRDFALLDPQDAPLVSWQSLRVELNEAEPLVPRVDVKSIELAGAQARVHRDGKGALNFSRIMGGGGEKPVPSGKPFPLALKVGAITLDLAKLRFTDEAVAPALDAVIGQAQVRAGGLSAGPGQGPMPVLGLEDLVLVLSGVEAKTGAGKQALVRIEALELKAQGLSTAPGKAAHVALTATVGKGGSVAASGPLTVEPFSTRLALDVRRLGIVPAQRYVDEYIHLAITSGAVSANGSLALEAPAGRPLRLSYKGNAGLYDFASVDKRSTQDLLKWKALALDGIDFDLESRRLSLDAIALSDYYARVIVSAEGRVNLQDLAVESKDKNPGEEKKGEEPPFRMRIGTLALQGGNVNFSDFFIRPNYSANLTGVGGAVTEMRADKPGDVELRGKIDNAAPVEILGRINPLAGNLFLDIKASARDIELAPLSPYSVKYAGYGIERGKLSLNVKYHIEDRKLVAENQVYLDQLTFGNERVDSPTATTLPVTFAIALLKDRNGVIDLNLPISGSLDDPEFSLFGIIAKVVGNLIVKAITAPFALLGALFGGGEELAFVEFEPGSSALDPGDQSKLGSLAKALGDRPALKLDVTGRAEPEADREGLKRASIAAKVRAQKFNDLRRSGKAPASTDDVLVEPAEYERYLRRAYSAEKFPKPRNALGFEKELPVAEMETLMLAHAAVAEDDLRILANARAQSAKEWLITDGKIAAERVYIIAPKLSPEGIKDTGKPTRVDFALK